VSLSRQTLLDAIPHCLRLTDLGLPTANRYTGKVRDTYDLTPGDPGGRLLLLTTDRQSGFDRLLGAIPFKGQVLNRTSLYWFQQTAHIVPNHVLSSPHANALLARKCRVLPIEFVVRGYLTGSTDTSIWTKYQAGERRFAETTLPEGMRKNQPLPTNLITPTTKEAAHDRPITPADIVAEGWLTQAQWDFCSDAALKLFRFGQDLARQRGLILVDTKYEFGLDPDGQIRLIDEIHTPDSSRYWIADTYEQRMSEGKEPDMIDKEFFRLWFRERCDPYKDAVLPTPPPELIAELAGRYIQLFERITGGEFSPDLRPLTETVLEALHLQP
jgi:phosphoribosylaminoimidazole-succinocarboxamide synthase